MDEYEENLIVDMHDNPMYWAEKYLELEAQLADAREALKEIAVAAGIAAESGNKHLVVWIADRADMALTGQGGSDG